MSRLLREHPDRLLLGIAFFAGAATALLSVLVVVAVVP